MIYSTTENFSTPSYDEAALIAIMRLDAAVLAERDNDADEGEAARREKIRAARLGKKQSPDLAASVLLRGRAQIFVHTRIGHVP
jgi:hypothetical protein